MSGIFGDDSLGTTRAVSPLVAPARRPAMMSSGAQVPQFQSAWWRFTITVNGQFAGKTFEQQLTDGQAKQMAQTVYSQNSAGKTGVKILGEKRVGNSWVNAGVMAPLSGFGQLSQQEIDCAALCSTFMLTFGGPAAVAMCAQRCQEMTATKTCFVPSVCVEVASKYPNLMSPELVKTYCGLPKEAQQGIDIQCNAIAANMANQTLPVPPPPVPPPAPPPGPTPPFEPAEEPPAQEAGIGIGTLAIVGAVGIGAYLLLRKKGRR